MNGDSFHHGLRSLSINSIMKNMKKIKQDQKTSIYYIAMTFRLYRINTSTLYLRHSSTVYSYTAYTYRYKDNSCWSKFLPQFVLPRVKHGKHTWHSWRRIVKIRTLTHHNLGTLIILRMLMMLKKKILHRRSARYHHSERIVMFIDTMSHVRLRGNACCFWCPRRRKSLSYKHLRRSSRHHTQTFWAFWSLVFSHRVTVPRFDTSTLLCSPGFRHAKDSYTQNTSQNSSGTTERGYNLHTDIAAR